MFDSYPTSILDIHILQPKRNVDNRGELYELFNQKVFPINTGFDVRQVTYSISKKGTIRGFHLQPGMAKVMAVVRGTAILSAVDTRPNSPTYRHMVNVPVDAGRELKMVYAPDWAARGFIAIEDNTTVLYFQNDVFNPTLSTGFSWASPDIFTKPWVSSGIDPHDFIVSDKDQHAPLFSEWTNPFARALS